MASDGDSSRARYDRFVEFERLMHVYPSGAISPSNPTPLGFCAFALTLFVYSFIMCGATVPIGTYAGPAMGLALFYGGLIQLIAGLLEFRSGNNFYALTFCSYGGYWFSLAALYVTGSFAFLSNPLTTPTAMPANDVYKSLGIFYLGWTIFTLAMLISSVRSNVVLIVFFFFLMLTYILLTASYFLSAHQDLARAGGAIGIFTSVIAWFLGFASLLRKGDNSYFNLPNYSLAPRTNAAAEGPVAKHKP